MAMAHSAALERTGEFRRVGEASLLVQYIDPDDSWTLSSGNTLVGFLMDRVLFPLSFPPQE